MAEQVKIEFGDSDDDTCAVKLDRSVSAGAPAYFGSPEEAQGNSLATCLLAIEELEAVMLQENGITLLKPADGAGWEVIQPQVESALVSHFEELDRTSESAGRDMTPEEKELFVRIQNILNAEVNPMVASHGGFIEVLDFKENTAFIHMGGGCQGCGMATVTLKQGVERAIREQVPQVQEILDTTDHAAGKNPYYAPSTK